MILAVALLGAQGAQAGEWDGKGIQCFWQKNKPWLDGMGEKNPVHKLLEVNEKAWEPGSL